MTAAEATPQLDLVDHSDRAFLGHPKGLGYLAFTEAWERFSYYGMQALLVLYLVNYLLLPGQCRATSPSSTASARLYGGLDGQPLASAIFGTYFALVYLTPILGGLLADRVLGKRRTVLLGAITMSVGHFLMAFELTLPVRLALPDPRQRHAQGQYREPGRRALQARGSAPRRRLPDLLSRHQRRRDRRAADRRHARREYRLALGLRRGRRRHADLASPSTSPARNICRRNISTCRVEGGARDKPAAHPDRLAGDRSR